MTNQYPLSQEILRVVMILENRRCHYCSPHQTKYQHCHMYDLFLQQVFGNYICKFESSDEA